MNKIIEFIKSIISFTKKYDIVNMASSISFYMTNAIISLFILFSKYLYKLIGLFNDFLFVKILEIFNNNFINIIEEINSFNGLSVILIINIIWTTSRILNCFNNATDRIYIEIDPRNKVKNRILSFFMFGMILFIILFEMALFIIGIGIIKNIGNKYIILKIFEIILEIILIYTVISIIYIYVPPIKMKFIDVSKISFVISLILYGLLILFLLIIRLIYRINIIHALSTIFAFSYFVILFINYILLSGIALIYQQKNVHIRLNEVNNNNDTA